ncbi:hypothetical protein GCK32_018618 [Trichostrongylus colubriformis]|uniref:Uncharacterized protein n=1 Tax=Trichostrongylus colubriformis TaxID=6319 RepID=A0AAN8FTA0_TRICO
MTPHLPYLRSLSTALSGSLTHRLRAAGSHGKESPRSDNYQLCIVLTTRGGTRHPGNHYCCACRSPQSEKRSISIKPRKPKSNKCPFTTADSFWQCKLPRLQKRCRPLQVVA